MLNTTHGRRRGGLGTDRQVTIYAAKTNLSKLIEAALRGEEVIIARGSKPVVRLVPVTRGAFSIGLLKDRLGTGPDVFEPMDDADWTPGRGSLSGDSRLTKPAVAAIAAAGMVLASPITFFEIAQTVRLGRWPEMEPVVKRLDALLAEQGGMVAGFDPAACLIAGMMDWVHPDPFDRLLAATAMHYKLPLVSADAVFDGIVTRLW